MKRFACLASLVLLFAGASAVADNPSDPQSYLFAFGGSGDPAGPSTIFDNGFENIGVKARADHWHATVLFAGSDNAGSVEKVAAAFGAKASAVLPFDPGTFDAQLNSIKSKISSIPSGSTVVLWMDSHGAAPDGKNRSHEVVCGDGHCSMDRFEPLLALLKSRHIKTALVDLSCHSGATQALAGDEVCVISASRRDTVSLESFGDSFTKALRDGRNFEDAFLDARDIENPYNPEIDSPAGREAARILDEAMNGISDETIPEQPANACILDTPVAPLIDQLKAQIRTISDRVSESDLAQFETALARYRETLRSAREQKAALELDGKKDCKVGTGEHVSWSQLRTYDAALLAKLESGKSDCDSRDDNVDCERTYRAEIRKVKDGIAFREKSLKENPDYASYEKRANDFEAFINDRGNDGHKYARETADRRFYEDYGQMASAAFEVLQAEHGIYKKLYTEFSRSLKDQPNPCKDLKL